MFLSYLFVFVSAPKHEIRTICFKFFLIFSVSWQNFANCMCSAMYLSCVDENRCVTSSIAFRHVFLSVKSNSTVSSAPNFIAYALLSRVAARISTFSSPSSRLLKCFESNARTSFPTRPVEPVTRITVFYTIIKERREKRGQHLISSSTKSSKTTKRTLFVLVKLS